MNLQLTKHLGSEITLLMKVYLAVYLMLSGKLAKIAVCEDMRTVDSTSAHAAGHPWKWIKTALGQLVFLEISVTWGTRNLV